MNYFILGISFVFFSVGSMAEESAREDLFTITPEQMVFASKLGDASRKIYCHQFSMTERQEAIEEWKLSLDEEEMAALSPDEAVQDIADLYYSSGEDLLINLGDTR
ncbi:MAG: hypothetical protein NTX49_05070 [Chlamydiae bacterium]|nr:hypothetical protein [Chlamydiota bacterium]